MKFCCAYSDKPRKVALHGWLALELKYTICIKRRGVCTVHRNNIVEVLKGSVYFNHKKLQVCSFKTRVGYLLINFARTIMLKLLSIKNILLIKPGYNIILLILWTLTWSCICLQVPLTVRRHCVLIFSPNKRLYLSLRHTPELPETPTLIQWEAE